MQINISKTKEMILGRLNIDNLLLLSTSLGSVEHITSFNLLGINLDAKLSWSLHINIISAKWPQVRTFIVAFDVIMFALLECFDVVG